MLLLKLPYLALCLHFSAVALDFFDLSENILTLVCVEQAELFIVDLALLVEVERVVDQFEIAHWQVDAGVLAAFAEFLEGEHTVKIHVEVAERLSIILEFLLNPQVHKFQNILYVLLLMMLMILV